jgi:hypothetical protein
MVVRANETGKNHKAFEIHFRPAGRICSNEQTAFVDCEVNLPPLGGIDRNSRTSRDHVLRQLAIQTAGTFAVSAKSLPAISKIVFSGSPK